MLHCHPGRTVRLSLFAALATVAQAGTMFSQTTSPGDTPFEERPTPALVTPDPERRASIIPGPCTPETTHAFVPARQTLSAVFYFPWHLASAECPAGSVWCQCIWRDKPGDPRPVLGLYDSGDRTVVDTHMDWFVQHGIQVVGVEWNGEFNGTREEDNFDSHLLPSIEARSLQFVLLYDILIRFDNLDFNFNREVVRNRFVSDFQAFAASNRFFKHPKYLKFNNRPVIYVYVSRAISEGQPNNETTSERVNDCETVRVGFLV